MNNKISKERVILDLAKPVLDELYGSFEVIDEQIDLPDAAIFLTHSKKKIGIEITSVDSQKAQQYFNDEKISKDVVEKQLENLISNKEYDSQAIKKMTVTIEFQYIAEQILKKASKYDSYNANDDYEEIIILAFSEYIEVDKDYFDFEIKPKVWNSLKEKSLQFDKVIFVSTRDKKAKLIFDRNGVAPYISSKNMNISQSITISRSSILPVGKEVSIKGLFDNSNPILKPNFEKKKKKKNV